MDHGLDNTEKLLNDILRKCKDLIKMQTVYKVIKIGMRVNMHGYILNISIPLKG